MEKCVKLRYNIFSKNIDEIIAKTSKLRDTRDLVKAKFNGYVKCEIVKDTYTHSAYVAVLKEIQEGKLEYALRKFFSEAGLPSYVQNGSDWDSCNKVLVEYGKKVKRQFQGFVDGKNIVDL